MAFHASRGRRLTLAALAATAALMPQLASAHPREFLQTNSWDSVVQDYPAPPIRQPRRWRANRDYAYGSDQVYREAPLTAEQVAQRCNIGRLLGAWAVALRPMRCPAMTDGPGRYPSVPCSVHRWAAALERAAAPCHGDQVILP